MRRALRAVLTLAVLLAAPAFLCADSEQPPYQSKDAGVQQNLQELYYTVDRLAHGAIVASGTSGVTLSDGTNSFTVGTIHFWATRVTDNFVELHVGGEFTTGGTVTGTSLRMTGFPFTIDTAGTILGAGMGMVATSAAGDPRPLVSPTSPSNTAINLSRSNGGAWATGTVYDFGWTGLVPVL